MPHKRILLVEDDRWIADVLMQIAETASEGAVVDWHTDVFSAQGAFDGGHYDLVICDWNLPGLPGIEMVSHVRRTAPSLPVVMITGRSDRASVLAARTHGADAFIVKPFQVERVLALMQRYLGKPEVVEGEAAPAPELFAYLDDVADAALELPSMHGIRHGLELLGDQEAPDLRQLAREWEHEPGLCARLIAMSNSVAYNPSGTVCTTLSEALLRLGWKTSVNVATAMAMRRSTQLDDPRLAQRAQREMELAEEVSDRVFELAHRCRIDPAPCHTAALLHRMGELCVLLHLQQYQNHYGKIDDAQIETAIERYSRPFADRLKAHWRLPMPLRELIGAIYVVLPGTTRQEKFLMRVAGHQVYHDLDAEEEARLRRLAGLL